MKYRIILEPATTPLRSDWYRVEKKYWWWPFWMGADTNFFKTKEQAQEYLTKVKNRIVQESLQEYDASKEPRTGS